MRHAAQFQLSVVIAAVLLGGCDPALRKRWEEHTIKYCTPSTEDGSTWTILRDPPPHAEEMLALAGDVASKSFRGTPKWLRSATGQISFCRIEGTDWVTSDYWVFDGGETPKLIDQAGWITLG